jgi:hypothetical protein
MRISVVQEHECAVNVTAVTDVFGGRRGTILAMKTLLVLLLACAMAQAQDSSQSSSSDIVAAAAAARARKANTEQTHTGVVELNSEGGAHSGDVRALVETMGLREKLDAQRASSIEKGRAKIAEVCPRCDPRFGQEWGRRFNDWLAGDQIMDICANAFARHLSDDDIAELLDLGRKKAAHQPAEASPHLKQKMEAALPLILGDLAGDIMRASVENSARIAQDIGREHPEWIKK